MIAFATDGTVTLEDKSDDDSYIQITYEQYIRAIAYICSGYALTVIDGALVFELVPVEVEPGTAIVPDVLDVVDDEVSNE